MTAPAAAFDILDTEPPRLRTSGRASRPLSVTVVRELTAADLALLDSTRGSKPPRLLRLRDSHHALARALASGMTPGRAGAMTGYSQSRISILQADASFQDLMEVYRRTAEEAYTEYSDIATGNMIRAERLIQDSLEAAGEASEPLPIGELRPLLDIVSDRADRFGYHKKTTSINVNVDFAGRLEKARQRSGLSDLPAEALSAPSSTGAAPTCEAAVVQPTSPPLDPAGGSSVGSKKEPAA